MSRTIDHLIRLLDDLPGDPASGVDVTVRGVFGARIVFGSCAGASHEESAALAATAFEPESDGPRSGAFVSREEARSRIRDLIWSSADPERISEDEVEHVARSMMDAVMTGASSEVSVWCARLGSASLGGFVVVGAAFAWTIRMTGAPSD